VRGQAVSEYRSELYDIVGALSLLHACYAIHDYKYMSFFAVRQQPPANKLFVCIAVQEFKTPLECEVIDDISVTLLSTEGMEADRENVCIYMPVYLYISTEI